MFWLLFMIFGFIFFTDVNSGGRNATSPTHLSVIRAHRPLFCRFIPDEKLRLCQPLPWGQAWMEKWMVVQVRDWEEKKG